MTASVQPAGPADRVTPYAWFVFGMVFLLGFLDFAVRQMVVGMFPLLKADWQLDDKSMGALAAIVPIVVGIAVLPTAFLIDRWSRVKAIFAMALLWSLGTLACGLAASYSQLLVARGFVGLGEAGYGPAGFALLAWYFPSHMRATVIGGVLVAATLGSVLGIAAGGMLGEHWGWHATFLGAGVISLVATFAFLLVRDYPTAPVVKGRSGEGRLATVARALLMSPTALCAYGAGATQMFVISTLTVWLPSYFTRSYDMTAGRAAMVGATAVLLGSFGTLVWARLADRWSRDDARGRLYAPAIGSALTAVLLMAAFVLVPPGMVQLGLIMAAALAMTACYGPVNAVVMDVVQPGLRATATAMVSFFQNILGLAAGPLLIGFISDHYGLGTAFTVLPLFSLISAGCFLLACRSYQRERDAIAALAK